MLCGKGQRPRRDYIKKRTIKTTNFAMRVLEKISDFVSSHMAAIVLVMALLALLAPGAVSFIKTDYVNTLLGIVMFGMGLTLKPVDFRVVFARPKDVVIGFFAQFTIMPLLAFVLSYCFRLSPELTVGVILVGTCPGGTSSNVMTYLAKGDVALSVAMTAVSTILAPVATPLLTWLYAGQTVDVNILSMFLSIVQVVLLPIALGFVINRYFSGFARRAVSVLPLVSTLAIVAIVGAVVSANAAKLMTCGLTVLCVVMLHNVLGYALGYGAGKLMRMNENKCRTVAIEVGMQNSGLATSLATVHFAQYPLATIPGAVFSVWHNVSGAMLANLFRRHAKREDKSPN
jgi:bile acid:Na+ symporter, BASS family